MAPDIAVASPFRDGHQVETKLKHDLPPIDDFYWDDLPLDVLIRFDALPPKTQGLFAVHLKPNEDSRAYCKEQIKPLKSAAGR
jgi:hypothetical protein